MICPFFFFASHHIHSTLGFFFFVHQRKNLQTKYEEGIFAQRSWTLHKLAIILTREVGLLLKSAAFQTIILIATVLEFWKKPRSSAFFDRVEFLENSDDSLVWWQISTFLQLTTEFMSCYQILHNTYYTVQEKAFFRWVQLYYSGSA